LAGSAAAVIVVSHLLFFVNNVIFAKSWFPGFAHDCCHFVFLAVYFFALRSFVYPKKLFNVAYGL